MASTRRSTSTVARLLSGGRRRGLMAMIAVLMVLFIGMVTVGIGLGRSGNQASIRQAETADGPPLRSPNVGPHADTITRHPGPGKVPPKDVLVLSDESARAHPPPPRDPAESSPRQNEERPDVARPSRGRSPHASESLSPPAANFGFLDVNVRPWANVKVDGADQGTTPLKALKLKVGSHKITLSNQQLSYNETVHVRIKIDQVVVVNKKIKH